MSRTEGLLLAASIAIAAPLHAQQEPVPTDPGKIEKVVEGDTPDRVAQIERCQGHKFNSLVEIDPVRKRTTRVKLCANPGATDADWIKTLEAAVVQIEQRAMPPQAKDKLIGELNNEIARFAPVKSVAVAKAAPLLLGGDAFANLLAGPTERYETSVLPPLPAPRGAATAKATTVANAAPPQRPMRIGLKCLERGQSGAGSTCDFFVHATILSISAIEGLEDGGILRFKRRGDARGEVVLAPLSVGQSARVRLPGELCRGVANTKFEIELLPAKAGGSVAARLGPYGLRC